MFNLNKIREKYVRQVRFYMQTNVTLWNDEWAAICARYNIIISSSYDIDTSFRSYNYKDNKSTRSLNIVLTKNNIDNLIDMYKNFNKKNMDINYIFPYETNLYNIEDILGDKEYAIKKYVEFLDFYLRENGCRNMERSANS